MREKKKKNYFCFVLEVFFLLLCDVHVGTSGKTRVVKQAKIDERYYVVCV